MNPEDDTIIITGSEYNTTTIDISSLTVDTIDIDLDNITINHIDPVEFEDTMPDLYKIKSMCEDYPALEKAYEKFKTIYKMVHQDWKGKQDEQDSFPF